MNPNLEETLITKARKYKINGESFYVQPREVSYTKISTNKTKSFLIKTFFIKKDFYLIYLV